MGFRLNSNPIAAVCCHFCATYHAANHYPPGSLYLLLYQHFVTPAFTYLAAPQEVDLCANQLMRPGALAVARALTSRGAGAAPLALLGLDENAISETGVEALRRLLKVR
jgi:hypothetical protein